MRTEPMPPWDEREEFLNAHCRTADHRAPPHQVLENINDQLAAFGLEVVLIDSGSDEYVWRVAKIPA